MSSSSIRKQLPGAIVLLLPALVRGQGMDSAMEELDSTFTNLALITVLATISLLLLLIVRNGLLGLINLLSGVALIVIAAGEMARFVLTDTVTNVYISSGFIQLALAVIFGWICRKDGAGPQTGSPLRNKRAMIINVVILMMALESAFYYIRFCISNEPDFQNTHSHSGSIVTIAFLFTAALLFMLTKKAGWVLATAYLFSAALLSVTGLVNTVLISSQYKLEIPVVRTVFNAVCVVLILICLFLVLSRSLRETFNIKRLQIVLALAAGIAIGALVTYDAILTITATHEKRYREKINAGE